MLLTPTELDDVLRYPPGKSQRLARRNLLPHITLPDGSVRFRPAEIEKLIGVEISDNLTALITPEPAGVSIDR